MIKKINKKIVAVIMGMSLVLGSYSPLAVGATELDSQSVNNDEIFVAFDEDGNLEYIPVDEVEDADQDLLDSIAIPTASDVLDSAMARTISITDDDVASISTSVNHGVVVFKNRDGSTTTSYTDAKTGAAGYTNGLYGPDAAYLGMQDGKVKFMLAGVTGLVSSSQVQIYEYDTFINSGMITSSYSVKNGRIYHQITTNLKSVASTQLFGYQQSYMKDDTTYYSYDGHYFYESYKTMVSDYVAGHFNNSINKNQPYYNYYMFLTHRTKTNFTATELDTYIKSKTSNSSSKMLNLGSTFISAQNSYGSNGALMFGLAINESAYGLSSIALSKNNLFGHGAVDSNPYYGSTGYSTAADSVKYHAQYFVSRQYLDAVSDSRYYGAHLGNKESGMNVKYASDPYWSEKAASHCFRLEDVDTSSVVDYNKLTQGIVNGSTPIYNSPDGKILYYAKNKGYSSTNNIPVVVLDTTTSNGVTWYKIQSDMPVVAGRGSVIYSQIYNYTNDYVYVKASLVKIVNGDAPIETGIKLGDANQDGSISSLDYMVVKNYIMGTSSLSGDGLVAADANEDGTVSSLDYMLIKNHIMGTITLN